MKIRPGQRWISSIGKYTIDIRYISKESGQYHYVWVDGIGEESVRQGATHAELSAWIHLHRAKMVFTIANRIWTEMNS